MKQILNVFIILLFCVACTTTSFYGTVENPITVAVVKDEKIKLNTYSETFSLEYYLWGALPSSQAVNLSRKLTLTNTAKKGNLVVEEYQSAIDIFKTIITFGMYYPVSYKISYDGEVL